MFYFIPVRSDVVCPSLSARILPYFKLKCTLVSTAREFASRSADSRLRRELVPLSTRFVEEQEDASRALLPSPSSPHLPFSLLRSFFSPTLPLCVGVHVLCIRCRGKQPRMPDLPLNGFLFSLSLSPSSNPLFSLVFSLLNLGGVLPHRYLRSCN